MTMAFGAGGLLAVIAAVTTAIGPVHHPSVGSGQVVLAGLRFTYPTLNGAEGLLLALAALGTVVLATAARVTWSQRRAYRGLIGRISVLGSLDRYPDVRVIEDPRPQAFCAGYLRPLVYVSQRTLDLLTDDELEAVVAHERHHRRVRDPLRFACGRILGRALFFVPVLAPLCDRYSDVAELEADEAAIRASAGKKGPLASALLVFEANTNPEVAGISPERVDSLLGEPARWRLPARATTASLATLAALSALIWRASTAASAQATFNPPLVSAQPCLLMLTLLVCSGLLIVRRRRGKAQSAWRRLIRNYT